MSRPKIFFNSIDYETEREHIEYIKNELDDCERNFKKANASFDMEIRDLKWYDAEQRVDALSSINNSRYCLNTKSNDAKTIVGSPYFARIDYTDKNNTKRIVYISKGKIKSVLKDYDDVKYVNWRSPVAGLLYQYNYKPIRRAELKIDSLVRSVDIELVAKIKINHWMLDNITYSSLTEYEDLNQKQIKSAINQELQDKLAAGSSDKMSEIVDTIQSDQYDIIRQDFERDLIIQGCAGSGKTAVALHRIAYLLYNGLESQEILFVSPNKDFSNYISNALPELGEVNILIKTLDEIYRDVFNDALLPKSFSRVIEDYLALKEKDKRINLFFDKDDDIDKVTRRHIEFAQDRRLILDRYFECLNQIKKTPYITIIKESKLGLTSPDLVWNNDNKTGTGISFDISIGENVDFTFYAIIDAIVKKLSYPKKVPKTHSQSKIIKHIVVDEAQDYTKWQMYLLHLLCPEATFTILGDRFQTANPYIRVYSKHNQEKNKFYQLLNEVNKERESQAIYQEIKTAYRSSPEIVAYCNEILGTNIVSVRDSQGIKVEEKISKSVDMFLGQLKNDIDRMISDGFLRIGIITDSADQASLLIHSFKKYKDNESLDFRILPFYKAKGLEFDAVVAIHDFEISDDYINSTVLGKEIAIDDRMLYIACTRAQHKLIVYYNPSQSFLDIVSLFLNYFNVYHKRFRFKLF